MQVDIAFITVNYNTAHYLHDLAAFFANLDVPFSFSLIVVDNDSQDGSKEFLAACRGITYIQSGMNCGYGRAINIGLTASESRYVCVMNTDVILSREALVALWEFMEQHQHAGLAAPRLTYQDGRHQGAVFHISLISHYVEWLAKLKAKRTKLKIAAASAPIRVDGVMGAFFLIRRSAVPGPTLFDEDFFFYYEDTALAHTLYNLGTACYVVPNAVIIHLGGKSSSSGSIAHFYANKYLYLKKFYGPFHCKAIRFMDSLRFVQKLLTYSLGALLTGSHHLQAKRHYYAIALSAHKPSNRC